MCVLQKKKGSWRVRGDPSKSLIFIEFEPPGALGEEGWGGDPQKSLIFTVSWPPWGLDFGIPFGTLFGS